MTSYLLDTSVLVRRADLSANDHRLTIAVLNKLIGAGHNLYYTAQNAIELWSVMTRPTASNGLGVTPQDAHNQIQRLPTILDFLPDRPEVFPTWEGLVSQSQSSGRQVHDGRLAAVAIVYGVDSILTFNTADFVRYQPIEPNLAIEHPESL